MNFYVNKKSGFFSLVMLGSCLLSLHAQAMDDEESQSTLLSSTASLGENPENTTDQPQGSTTHIPSALEKERENLQAFNTNKRKVLEEGMEKQKVLQPITANTAEANTAEKAQTFKYIVDILDGKEVKALQIEVGDLDDDILDEKALQAEKKALQAKLQQVRNHYLAKYKFEAESDMELAVNIAKLKQDLARGRAVTKKQFAYSEFLIAQYNAQKILETVQTSPQNISNLSQMEKDKQPFETLLKKKEQERQELVKKARTSYLDEWAKIKSDLKLELSQIEKDLTAALFKGFWIIFFAHVSTLLNRD